MRKIHLNGNTGKYALVDDNDFNRLNKYAWHYHNLGYARNWKIGYMHKFINDTPIGFETDHINQNKLDNRRTNLRSVSRAINQANKPKSKNNSSGVPGVRWDKHRELWKVSFRWKKQPFNVGNFKDKARAISRLKEALADVRR